MCLKSKKIYNISQEKNIKYGVILNYLNSGSSIVIGIIYTPIMIQLLGQNEYGLYNLAVSVISILGVLDFGLASAYTKYYQRAEATKNEKEKCKINGMFQLIYTIIAIIIILCGFILINYRQIIFGNKIMPEEMNRITVLLILMISTMGINFLFVTFNCYIYAKEQYIWQQLIALFTNIVNPFITLPLLFMGYKSIAITVISLLFAAIRAGLNFYYAVKKMNMRFKFTEFDFTLFREIFSFSIWVFVQLLIGQVNWNLDRYILGNILGTGAVAIYAVGATFYRYCDGFSVILLNVLRPKIHKIQYTENAREGLNNILIKNGRIQFMVLALIITGYLFVGEWFIIHYYAGKEYIESFWVGLVLMFGGALSLLQKSAEEMQYAKDKQKIPAIIHIIAAILNIAISLILCKYYQAVGCALGTMVSIILGDIIVLNYYYQKYLDLDMIAFWKNVGRMFVGLIGPFVFGVFFSEKVNSWLSFAIFVCIYVIIYIISMYKFCLNEAEKLLIKGVLGEKNGNFK